MLTESDVKGVIWWSCFLDSSDPIYDHISSIGDDLRGRGQQLVVIGPKGDYSRFKGFSHIEVPLSLTEQGRKTSNIPGPSLLPMTATAFPELMDAEQVWGQADNTVETEFLILRALRFWEKAFEIMRPSVILAWGSTLPLSKLLLRLAQLTQTPSYAMERGLLENTLMMSFLGQAQISNVGIRLQFIEPVIPEPELQYEWSAIESYYGNIAQRQPPSESTSSPPALSSDPSSKQGPTVLYLGAFDVGSGMAFDNVRTGDRYSSWVRHSKEGARLVAKSLAQRFPNSTLLIKPHPATSFSLSDEAFGINIVEVGDADFKSLISHCDVCVTSISTTQIYGFVYDKPIVTLANGFFTGRNITYEATDLPSLDEALTSAIERDNWDEKRARAKALITSLFREEFICLTDDAPGKLKRSHLVEHLARFVSYRHPSTETASKRIEHFRAFEALSTGHPIVWSEHSLGLAIGATDWAKIKEEIQKNLCEEVSTFIAGRNNGSDKNSKIKDFANQINQDFEQRLQEIVMPLENALQIERNLVADLETKKIVYLSRLEKIEGDIARLDNEKSKIELDFTRTVEDSNRVLSEKDTIIDSLSARLSVAERGLTSANETLKELDAKLPLKGTPMTLSRPN